MMAFTLGLSFLPHLAGAETQRSQIIRFLGVTVVRDVQHIREGAVGELIVAWEERTDHHGIVVSFLTGNGSSVRTRSWPFSPPSIGRPMRQN